MGAANTTCAVSGLTNDAPVSFAVFAFDEAPNYATPAVATVTPRATVVPDTKAPARVRSLTARAKGGKVKLTWKKPADNDVVRYAVVRNKKRAPKSLRDGEAIYSGKAPKATVSQKAGSTAWYAVFALDAAANVSKGATVEVEHPGPARSIRVPARRWTARSSCAGTASRAPRTTTSRSSTARSASRSRGRPRRATACRDRRSRRGAATPGTCGPARGARQGPVRQPHRQGHVQVRRLAAGVVRRTDGRTILTYTL